MHVCLQITLNMNTDDQKAVIDFSADISNVYLLICNLVNASKVNLKFNI